MMAGNRMLPGAVEAERAGRPVLSGRLPALSESCLLRQETGLALDGLPPDRPIVLITARRDAPPNGRDLGDLGDLHDLGGTGKTQLAAALARAHLDRPPSPAFVDGPVVVWIAATSEDAIITGYAQALHDVGAPAADGGPERAAAAFLKWLAGTGRPWLVVLDDLGDPAVAERWWPAGAAGRVLVTSDHPALAQWRAAHVVPVGAFSPREALWYLAEQLRADHDQRTGATDLAIELEFMPIALAHAAAFITETGWNCRQYIELVAHRQAQLTGPGGTPSPAAVTCSLSAQLADQLAPAGLAGRALALISVLSPAGIPGGVLTSQAARSYLGGAHGYPVEADEAWAAVRNLARAGLVIVDDDGRAPMVLAHALVQGLARQNSTAAGREQAVRAGADALAEAWPTLAGPPRVAQALRDCTAKLQEADRAVLWAPQCHPVLIAAGQSLVNSGMPGRAVAYWRAMLAVSERHFGTTHAQTAQLRDLLAEACELSGHPDEAIAMYTDLLAHLEQAGDGCEPEVLVARASLSRAQASAGRPADAIRLARQTLDRCEQVRGAAHPDTLDAAGHLADSYLAAGQFKQAIELCKQTLAERERVQGVTHADTIAARAALATAYRSGGKLKDAIKQYERTLADREKAHGATDMRTIAARRDLAYACCVAGKWAYSVAQYEHALADCHQVLGAGHELTVATQEDLDAVAGYGFAKLGIDLRTPKTGKS